MLERSSQWGIRNMDDTNVRMSHIDHQKHRSGNRQGADEHDTYNRRIWRRLKTERRE
jgi:hypothetical protein